MRGSYWKRIVEIVLETNNWEKGKLMYQQLGYLALGSKRIGQIKDQLIYQDSIKRTVDLSSIGNDQYGTLERIKSIESTTILPIKQLQSQYQSIHFSTILFHDDLSTIFSRSSYVSTIFSVIPCDFFPRDCARSVWKDKNDPL